MTSIQPGTLVFIDPGETVGHEQRGKRPYLVVSTPGKAKDRPGNLGLIVAVPLTTTGRPWWTVVRIPKDSTGLEHDSFALCHQVRSLSVDRAKHIIGFVSDYVLTTVRLVLITMLST